MADFLTPRMTRRSLLRGALGGAMGVGLLGIPGGLRGHASAIARTGARIQPGAARWTRLSPSGVRPSRRRDHSLTFDEARGVLYLYGGRVTGPDVGLEDLWRFDPQTTEWARVPVEGPVPPGRFGHNASYDATSGRLIVALGQASSTVSYDDVWAFDPETSTWSRLADGSTGRPVPRYGAAGGYDRAANRLLISHGFTIEGRFDDTWQFDVAADAWAQIPTTGTLPIPRCLTRGLWDPTGARFLLFGGQSDVAPFHGDFWSLNPRTGVWTDHTSAVLPSPRHLHGTVFDEASGQWYLFGGRTEAGPAADLWVYEPATDSWATVDVADSLPPARLSMDMAWTPERVYLFGGNDGAGDLDDTWSLEISAPSGVV